uniref:Uncharacterized protein n=1 Tax=Hyalomma excavatum TaxID=257692 RepID=A0A131XH37_9ACAR
MEIHLKGALLIVPLLALLCKGNKVNLTDEARIYVEKQNTTGMVDSWGLSGQYEYWFQEIQERHGHAIYPWAGEVTCTVFSSGVQRGNFKYNCEEWFSLYIQEGMESPFRIYAEVHFPLIGEHPLKVKSIKTVNLNNQTQIHVDVRTIPGKALYKSCEFQSKVTFNGNFAYHLKGEKIEDDLYVPVAAGKLANPQKKLSSHWDSLQYTIKGMHSIYLLPFLWMTHFLYVCSFYRILETVPMARQFLLRVR